MSTTLFDKVWIRMVRLEDGPDVFFIDRISFMKWLVLLLFRFERKRNYSFISRAYFATADHNTYN
jgi:hypothetical protein